MHLAATTTAPRNTRRVDMLAGCSPLAVEMIQARAAVVDALRLHRNAHRATSPLARQFATQPHQSRERVRKASAIEAKVEATYGAQVPGRAAAPVLLAAE
jgi:hypothetical protein